jgi:sporulation protein YlmC with PRC-barrel domain
MSTSLRGSDLEGRTVYSSDGEKLGKVSSVLEDDMGHAQYIEVTSGWFGTRRHTIPLQGLQHDGDDLRVAYTKQMLEGAPTFEDHEHIDYDRERTLGAHYGHGVRDWDDTRDRWLDEEDLSRGPTPETRHPHGGLDDASDITQGPTPETRDVLRRTEDDPTAAGQPMADSRTREGGGAVTDRDRDLGTTDRMGDRDMGTGGMGTGSMAGTGEGMMAGGERGAGGSYRSGRIRLRRYMAAGSDTGSGMSGVTGTGRAGDRI